MVFARPLRAAVVALIGLSILVSRDDVRSALPFGVGVLFAAMVDHGGPLRTRVPPMAGTAVAITFGTLLGGLVSDGTVLNIVVGGVVALLCGFAGAAGATWMFGGILTLVCYTIFGGAPIPLLATERNTVWMAIGSAVLLASAVLAHATAHLARRWSTARSGPRSTPTNASPQPETQPQPRPADMNAWQRARVHLQWRDDFVLHAIRLSIVIMVALLLEEELAFPHSYWIPMTVAWITRPDRDGTIERVILRSVGTLAGIAIAGTFIVIVDPSNALSVVMTSLAVFIVLTFLAPNYAIAVIGITIFVFFLFNIVGYPVEQMIETRVVATLMAAVLVAVAIHIGPRPVPVPSDSN